MGYKDIYSIPLPKECEKWEVSGTELYAVKGIEDEYYGNLNKTIVKKLPKGYEAKRRVIDKVHSTFKRNEDGSYVYEEYKVPSGSVVVLSDKGIKLSYSRFIKDIEGYGYIDFVIQKGGKVYYMYVLPKSKLYKVHQTALAISVKNMKNFNGMGIVSWNSGTLFIHIIPYNPNSSYIGSKILKTGYSLNYKKEIDTIVRYWEQVGITPKIELCGLQNGENICLKSTVVGYDSYNPVEQIPISDKEIFGSEEEEEE